MRTLFYFLLYPAFGPFLGFAIVTVWFSILGSEYIWESLTDDEYWVTIFFAWLIGIMPALITGAAAAFQFARYGKSNLLINIPVAMIASLVFSLRIGPNDAWPFHIFVIIIGALSALVLRGVEILFQDRSGQTS